MPSVLAFDTLAYAKKMKAAGFTELQAELQTEALVEIVENRLATRQNLKELEVALRQDTKELEVALRRDMKKVEVALRQDIKEVEVALRRDMKKVEVALRQDIGSLKHDMKEMEQRLIIRMGGLIATSIIIVAALVKLL